MAPSTSQVLAAVKATGSRFVLENGWDSSANASKQSPWDPHYVILHHTANSGAGGNNPSLNWVMNNQYHPVRACNFLIGRDGTIFVIMGLACYHAGDGGPGRWGNGPEVSKGTMNRRAYGIEIESKGTSKNLSAVDGITQAQFDSTAKLTHQLLKMMGAKTENAINHRTWAGRRKTDTLFEDSFWHDLINKAAGAPVPAPKPTPTPTPTPKPPVRPTVSISRLIASAKADMPAKTGHKTWPAEVIIVERSLAREGFLNGTYVDGSWGTLTRAAYAKWQQRCGYSGKDADGYPGMASLTKLGNKYGFNVQK